MASLLSRSLSLCLPSELTVFSLRTLTERDTYDPDVMEGLEDTKRFLIINNLTDDCEAILKQQ